MTGKPKPINLTEKQIEQLAGYNCTIEEIAAAAPELPARVEPQTEQVAEPITEAYDARWWRYVTDTPPNLGAEVALVYPDPSSGHKAAGRIFAHDKTSDAIAYGCPPDGFACADDACDALEKHGYTILRGVRVWNGGAE